MCMSQQQSSLVEKQVNASWAALDKVLPAGLERGSFFSTLITVETTAGLLCPVLDFAFQETRTKWTASSNMPRDG